MDKPITTRLPDELVAGIRDMAEKEKIDVSTAIRKLLTRALEEQKLKIILEKLSSHKISIGKAAEELDVSIWEMVDMAKEDNIDWVRYNEKELEHDLRVIGFKK